VIRVARDCERNCRTRISGLLEPDGARQYERHTSACADYRDELAALRAVIDVLPMTAPQYGVPAGLRRRVLRTIENDDPARP